ncbi:MULTISPECIES: NADH-quinone oxidoreductase subunit K [Pseudomonadaceae]|jgi:multicomponent Na+:H+ antiporter subunit C|uniref:Multisubunit sodium/proton antiporter MrpC subunit n=1 Tax=Stutzerimonas stutzeri TaxID=316 RepID=A0A5S5BL65_STUST|nr:MULTISPECIES: NADH-quinone oxidoreductase subunit K [Pseudomonadaceae]MDX2352265.1 NADH-quinone oxidoreductase subunit K [Stutzerimonas xanthomarina]TYP66932.1 multisubunit sodium/proton antiporter MrpC subunit [Stutzerimonas stutzeri]VXD00155.1 NADH:quinone oxidoreductase [Pseudomonas sp. 9Ag]HBS78371.1 NADH:quinone oxidoreductase [Pseudomonas sp.]|tara:strand:- start:28263 stop:28568 length:306 start_codon:yes stop_codon:yes gene_type:complete
MSSSLFWMIIGAALWLLGLHGLLTLRQALRRIIAFNLMGSGVFLVMIALATRSQPSDPLLVALVVTGLVVAISATALALRLASVAHGSQPQSQEHQQEPRQ